MKNNSLNMQSKRYRTCTHIENNDFVELKTKEVLLYIRWVISHCFKISNLIIYLVDIKYIAYG